MNIFIYDEHGNLTIRKPNGLEYSFDNTDKPELGFEYQVIVYDDISCYEHDTVYFYLKQNDYACVGRGDFKAVYIKGLDNASGFFV